MSSTKIWLAFIIFALLSLDRAGAASWGATTTIDAATGLPGSDLPALDLRVAPDGRIHAAWIDQTGPASAQVRYAVRSTAGAWSAPETVADLTALPRNLRIALDLFGSVHVMWSDGATRFRFRVAGLWLMSAPDFPAECSAFDAADSLYALCDLSPDAAHPQSGVIFWDGMAWMAYSSHRFFLRDDIIDPTMESLGLWDLRVLPAGVAVADNTAGHGDYAVRLVTLSPVGSDSTQVFLSPTPGSNGQSYLSFTRLAVDPAGRPALLGAINSTERVDLSAHRPDAAGTWQLLRQDCPGCAWPVSVPPLPPSAPYYSAALCSVAAGATDETAYTVVTTHHAWVYAHAEGGVLRLPAPAGTTAAAVAITDGRVRLLAIGPGGLTERSAALYDGDSLPLGYEQAHSCLMGSTADDNADPDADGLTSRQEYRRSSATDPCDADSDDDGRNDGAEVTAGTDPLDLDSDDDGLDDGAEFTRGTNPLDSDSDDDGIKDGAEVTAGTDPLDADSDDDGLGDGAELTELTDPLDADTDDDGRNDGAEVTAGTDPLDPDSDDDGLNDGAEASHGTDPLDADTDSDGLDDAVELNVRHTNPLVADTDDDDLDDGDEVNVYGTDPLNPNTDGDKWTDGEEVARGSNPLKKPAAGGGGGGGGGGGCRLAPAGGGSTAVGFVLPLVVVWCCSRVARRRLRGE